MWTESSIDFFWLYESIKTGKISLVIQKFLRTFSIWKVVTK